MSELYEIHAFGVIDDVLDQILDNVQPLGEMSDYSKTFSPKKTRYAKRSEYPDNHMVILNSTRDGVDVPLPVNTADRLLEVHQTLIKQFHPNNVFKDQLLTYLPSVHATATWGSMISYGDWLLPGWIRWEEYVNGRRVKFNLWLSDAVFRTTYELFEIRVIPPVRNLNAMTGNLLDFQAEMTSYTHAMMLEDISEQTKDGEDPATSIATLDLKWKDQATRDIQFATWTLVTYGAAGLSRTNQLEAIRLFLINKMGEIPAQWIEVIPELDSDTILTFYPLWHRTAIKGTGSISYQYSPTVGYREMANVLGTRWDNPTEFVLDRLQQILTPFKSLALLVHPEEIALSPKTFLDLYPSYTLVNIGTAEYRMLPELAMLALTGIEAACRIAEVIDVADLSGMPAEYEIESGDNLDFLCFTIGNIKHRVVTRQSWIAARG